MSLWEIQGGTEASTLRWQCWACKGYGFDNDIKIDRTWFIMWE